MNKTIFPKGCAIHTRGVELGKDYNWYLRTGDLWLSDNIQEIYKISLRDIHGEKRKLAVIVDGNRAGFMICDIQTDRTDHGNRIIYDTLYLECDETEIPCILKYVAYLLTCSEEEYEKTQQYAMEYAEKLYLSPQSDLEKYVFPCLYVSKNLKNKIDGKWAFPSCDENFRNCADYVYSYSERKLSSFVFISTGRAGFEKCRQIADKYNECLILTLSSEITKKVNLSRSIFSFFDLKENIISLLRSKNLF